MLSRRDFLANGGLGFGALALADLLRRDSTAAPLPPANPLAARPPHMPGTAKHVIFLFMQGGPSQLETFDPKPKMARFDGQLLPKELQDFDLAQINTFDSKVMAPIFPFRKYGESGQEISSIFPKLAEHADKLAIIRSLHHELFIHGSAMIMMHSGTRLLGHPSIGAWMVYGLGCHSDNLPSYVAMTDGMFRNGASMYTSGFLPAVYQGTYIKTEGAPIQNLERPPGVSALEQRLLLDQINRFNRAYRDRRPGDSRLDARIANYELAFRMQTAAPELIDLSRETRQTLQLYGIGSEPSDRYGKMCLMARRMVERGVRYVQLICGGWDAGPESRPADRRPDHRPRAAGAARIDAAGLGRRVRSHAGDAGIEGPGSPPVRFQCLDGRRGHPGRQDDRRHRRFRVRRGRGQGPRQRPARHDAGADGDRPRGIDLPV